MILLETLLSVGTGLFAAIGLGAWLPLRSVAGRVLVGLLLVPLFLIILSILLPLALSELALLILAVSFVGWFKFAKSIKRTEIPWILFNPVFVLPVLFAIGLLIVGDVGYQSFEWDEFASWLNWAKNLYLTDSLVREDANWRNLGYPQGWPTAVVFPQLSFATFEPMRSLTVGVLWHTAVLGLIYEVIIGYLAATNWASRSVIALTGYFLIFVLLAAETLRKLVPQDFLIELPQIFALAGVSALLCLAAIGAEKLKGTSLAAGLILAAGIMVKISVIAAVAPLALVIVYMNFGREKEGGGWKGTVLNLGLYILPIVIVQLIWMPLQKVLLIRHAG